MKGIIAFMFFMLFLAGLAFVMLKDLGENAANGTANVNILSGTWRLEASDAYIRFQSDGQFNGFAGCNNFFGTFVATDKTIELGPIGSTRKACADAIMAAEYEFLNRLQASTNYRIAADELTLSSDDGAGLQLRLSDTDTTNKEE